MWPPRSCSSHRTRRGSSRGHRSSWTQGCCAGRPGEPSRACGVRGRSAHGPYRGPPEFPIMAAEPLDTHSLVILAGNADRADTSSDWPAFSLQTLIKADATAWSIPADFGGRGFGSVELLHGYEALAE